MICDMPYDQQKVENQELRPLSKLWSNYMQNNQTLHSYQSSQLLQCDQVSNHLTNQFGHSGQSNVNQLYSSQNSTPIAFSQEPKPLCSFQSAFSPVVPLDTRYDKSVQESESRFHPDQSLSDVQMDDPNKTHVFCQFHTQMLYFGSSDACKLAQSILNMNDYFSLSEYVLLPSTNTISTQTEPLDRSYLPICNGSPETEEPVRVSIMLPKKPKLSNDDVPSALNMSLKNHSSSASKCRKAVAYVDHLGLLFDLDKLTLQDIKAFNNYWAAYIPHCSICSALSMRSVKGNKAMTSDWRSCQPVTIPSTTPIWISSMLFAVSNISKNILVENNRLLRCAGCYVTVHASCYGIQSPPQDNSWICNKCEYNVPHAKCCLCPLNVGAIKRVNSNQWIHALCAFLSSNTRLELESPSSDDSDSRLDDALSVYVIPSIINCPICCYCQQKVGNYVTCQRCDVQFHVMCGMIFGAMFANSKTEYYKLEIICHRHAGKENIPTPFRLGEEVYAKVKLEYCKVRIISIQDVMCYRIRPRNGSQMEVIPIADILTYSSEHHPNIGSDFSVTYWKRKLRFYQKCDCVATFLGIAHSIKYVVQFEDNSTMELDRKQIFSLDQKLRKIPIPNSVSQKVSSDQHVAEVTTQN